MSKSFYENNRKDIEIRQRRFESQYFNQRENDENATSKKPLGSIFSSKVPLRFRALVTNLPTKYLDTFSLYTGKKEQFGIFDYVLLGIPYLIERLDHWLQEKKKEAKRYLGPNPLNLLISLLILPFKLLNFFLNKLIRPITGYVFSLICTPFIVIAHGISQIVRHRLETIVAQKPNFLEEIARDPSAKIEIVTPTDDDSYNWVTLRLNHSTTPEEEKLKSIRDILFSDSSFSDSEETQDHQEEVIYKFNMENPQDREIFKSIFALNLGLFAQKHPNALNLPKRDMFADDTDKLDNLLSDRQSDILVIR